VRRLSRGLVMTESAEANAAFPARRLARVRLRLRDGRVLQSGWTTPRWDAGAPPSAAELRAKFHAIAGPALGDARAAEIERVLAETLAGGPLSRLSGLLCRPLPGDRAGARG